jgi:hydrogenase-4 component E
MNSISLVNTLSGVLIFTSLLVIEAKRPQRSALLYGVQSLALVLIFLALATLLQSTQLYWWALSAFVTKVLLVPFVLYRANQRMAAAVPAGPTRGPALSFVLAAAAVAVSFIVISRLDLRIAAEFKPALAVSVAHFFFGQLCILTQRNLLKQILGFCLMENGSHLTLALLAHKAPELVEVGIATDAVFGVVIMVVLAGQIYRSLHTLDAAELNTLKG